VTEQDAWRSPRNIKGPHHLSESELAAAGEEPHEWLAVYILRDAEFRAAFCVILERGEDGAAELPGQLAP